MCLEALNSAQSHWSATYGRKSVSNLTEWVAKASAYEDSGPRFQERCLAQRTDGMLFLECSRHFLATLRCGRANDSTAGGRSNFLTSPALDLSYHLR
jgi:hypothetical protein